MVDSYAKKTPSHIITNTTTSSQNSDSDSDDMNSGTKTDYDTGSDTNLDTDFGSDTETDPETETDYDTETEPKTETQPKTKTDSDTKPDSDPETDSNPETDSDPEPDSDPETQPERELQSDKKTTKNEKKHKKKDSDSSSSSSSSDDDDNNNSSLSKKKEELFLWQLKLPNMEKIIFPPGKCLQNVGHVAIWCVSDEKPTLGKKYDRTCAIQKLIGDNEKMDWVRVKKYDPTNNRFIIPGDGNHYTSVPETIIKVPIIPTIFPQTLGMFAKKAIVVNGSKINGVDLEMSNIGMEKAGTVQNGNQLIKHEYIVVVYEKSNVKYTYD